MAYKINEDLYIGNTNKQLKDLLVPVHDAYSTSTTDSYSCNYINHIVEGGQGVPTGGTTGQILTKKSDTDYDTEWADINGQVLYDNSTGTNGTVTLSDSAVNYDYMDIFYRDNDQTCSSVRVYNPDNKHVDISTISRWGNALYIKQKRITISGNKITNGNTTEVSFTTAPKIAISTSANNIYITRVIAY